MSDPEDFNPRHYEQKAAREAGIQRLRFENPSLSWQDVDALYARLEAKRRAAVHARCCPCQSPRRAEYVNLGKGVHLCECPCHPARPQGAAGEGAK